MSLKKYAELLPDSYHYLAASCFSLFNRPEIVPGIFKFAHENIPNIVDSSDPNMTLKNSELHLARQFREALLRAGIFGGMSRAINVRLVSACFAEDH